MRTLLLAALAGAVASSAEASTFRPISFGELVHSSEAVVQLKVVSTRSAWTSGPDPDLRTWAEVEVVRSLDGDLAAGDTLTLVEVGGRVDDYSVQAIGFPQLVAGVELVVFLTRWADGSGDWRVSQYGQGFYEVVREEGRELLFPAPLQGGAPGRTEVTLDTVVPRGTRVDDLAVAIRSVRR